MVVDLRSQDTQMKWLCGASTMNPTAPPALHEQHSRCWGHQGRAGPIHCFLPSTR